MKLLLALDCSYHSQKAAAYVAELLPRLPESEVVLFTSLLGVPYSEGDLKELREYEEPEVHGDEDHTQEVKQAKAFHKDIAKTLRDRGVSAERIHSVMRPAHRGTARDILDGAAEQGCDTVVVGRRGLSKIQNLLQGSVSKEVVQKAEGLIVWVIG